MTKFRYGDPAQVNRTHGGLIRQGKPTRQHKLKQLDAVSRNIRTLAEKAYLEGQVILRKRSTAR